MAAACPAAAIFRAMKPVVKEQTVIFDIDGTLADISVRRHHVAHHPKDWDAFFEAMAEDEVIHPIAQLCNTLYEAGFQISLCSGRPEKYRADTETWLQRHGVKYHDMHLRPDGDRRSDVIVKREMLQRFDRGKIAFVVEDRSRIVEMWRREGLICLQCAPGEF
jgi:hypothetical protein